MDNIDKKALMRIIARVNTIKAMNEANISVLEDIESDVATAKRKTYYAIASIEAQTKKEVKKQPINNVTILEVSA